jgi:tetratricopeptide (TPR) repeat protein
MFSPKKESPFKAPLAEKRDQFEDRLLLDWEGIRLFDWKTKASVYYVLEGMGEERRKYCCACKSPRHLPRVQPYPSFPENAYWEQMWYTSMLGCIYARLGETTKAKNQITELQRLGQLYPEIIALFHRGTSPYLIARIYAELGEKDLAVQYLQESAKQGRPFGYMSFTADMFLVNLKGYEPFEELIRPKG